MMTPTQVPTRDGSDQRSRVLLVAAAVLVVVTVVLVVVFGVQRPPELATLAAQPSDGPSTAVAWMAWDGDEACVNIARPSGEVTTPWCSAAGGEVVRWSDGDLVVRTWETGERLRTLDPDDGRATGWLAAERDPAGHDPIPDAAWSERDDGTLTVREIGSDRVLWQVEAPERYTVQSSALSADGAWIAMVDSAGRLLVVPADGSAPPRVWADEVPAWPAPVWEGDATTTG
ncbi:MAG TPA: hypothetical protein VK906_08115 [Egicoccus sp.]|nr:hypothetical protein [Egicoccus sp.]HSK23124.1 hypothetical protein [Egicoccus sp.]